MLQNLSRKKQEGESKLYTNVQNLEAKQILQQKGKLKSLKDGGQFDDDDEYFADVHTESLETVIDHLLTAIKDQDTIVRWSAAKGIGRITARLTMEMADEIIEEIMDILESEPNNDNFWHGAQLTIAELARRGLLLPRRLKHFFPFVHKALLFEKNQGNYTVGSNVRDSACYVVWAFARAYNPEILKPFVIELARTLLTVCIYDKEIHCRRAAAAAFQEHVGRQGHFPYGIEILTEADYFTLGVRNNAYLNVGIFVASYSEYFENFVNHLIDNKLKYPDTTIRRLSAASLCLLTVINPKTMIDLSVDELIKRSTCEMLHQRHGALYALGDILIALNGNSKMHNMSDAMKDSIFLKSLSLNEKKLIKSGEYMTIFQEKYAKMEKEKNMKLLTAE